LFLAILAEGSEPKINNFDHVGLLLNQHVVKLDVSMGDSSIVQVVKCFSDLFEKPATSRFFYNSVGAVLLYELMERNALDEVGHDANLFGCLDQIVHFYHIWVVDFLQSHNLSLNCLPLHAIVQLGLLINFYRKLLHVLLMVADVDDCISSLPDWFANLIVFQRSCEARLRRSRMS